MPMHRKRREVDSLYVFYADVFVMENCLINLTVLHGIARLEKQTGKKRVFRILAAAVLGAVLELLVLLLAGHSRWLYLFYSYGIVLPFQLIVSFGMTGRKAFFREYAQGFGFTALLCGISDAVSNLCGIRKLPFLAVFTLSVLLAETAQRIVHFYAWKKKLIPVELFNGEKQVSVLGLYDSGNRLREPYGGEAVHIAAPQLVEQLVDTGEKRGMLIPYRALGGTGLLRIYTISGLHILEPGMEKRIAPAVIGVAGAELMKQKDYQIILNQEVDRK